MYVSLVWKHAITVCVCLCVYVREKASGCVSNGWIHARLMRLSEDICVCACVCRQVLFGGLGQRRGKVSKITKSVWQLTISGFWLKFVDMTSPWVSPKRTPGILGCLPVLQTEQPVSWQNQAVQAPSPQCLPYLPAETPVIRVWAACRKKTPTESSVMDIANYAAILLMDATSSCCNGTHTHIHIHGHA